MTLAQAGRWKQSFRHSTQGDRRSLRPPLPNPQCSNPFHQEYRERPELFRAEEPGVLLLPESQRAVFYLLGHRGLTGEREPRILSTDARLQYRVASVPWHPVTRTQFAPPLGRW